MKAIFLKRSRTCPNCRKKADVLGIKVVMCEKRSVRGDRREFAANFETVSDTCIRG